MALRIPINDLKEIVSRGGGVIINARDLPLQDLKEIASRASDHGIVYVKSAEAIPIVDAKEIASRGAGHVVLDYTQ